MSAAGLGWGLGGNECEEEEVDSRTGVPDWECLAVMRETGFRVGCGADYCRDDGRLAARGNGDLGPSHVRIEGTSPKLFKQVSKRNHPS